mmetsp:Transcript_44609/g.133172  ORF Transcript_44609/g.133172 Transcript_44609/m.133172 type:complete len:216 (-) Transcript_44609:697-1344(-)
MRVERQEEDHPEVREDGARAQQDGSPHRPRNLWMAAMVRPGGAQHRAHVADQRGRPGLVGRLRGDEDHGAAHGVPRPTRLERPRHVVGQLEGLLTDGDACAGQGSVLPVGGHGCAAYHRGERPQHEPLRPGDIQQRGGDPREPGPPRYGWPAGPVQLPRLPRVVNVADCGRHAGVRDRHEGHKGRCALRRGPPRSQLCRVSPLGAAELLLVWRPV